MGRGADGVAEDDLLKTLQEVQLGLDALQKRVTDLVRVELLKKEGPLLSLDDIVGGSSIGSVVGPKPKALQVTTNR